MAPNFSMCVSISCPQNTKCYRKLAIPSEKQSYVNFDEEINKYGICHYFTEILPNDKITIL
jgi:hypothetical protein